jgi:hypothetical protein
MLRRFGMKEAQAVFDAYRKLTPQGRSQFDALLSVYAEGLKAGAQSAAGRKAAATKKEGAKAKAATGGTTE